MERGSALRRLIEATMGALLLATAVCYADQPPLIIQESDGSPTGVATKLKMPNGTLTKTGSTFEYTAAAGSGGGGGAAAVGVGTGTLSNFTNNVSTPTDAVSFLGSQFRVLDLGTTAVVLIDTITAGGLLPKDTAALTYQPLDATLTDLAAAPLTEDNSIDPTAVAAGSLPADVMASSVALAGFYSANGVRSNLGLAIGTNVEAWDADLDDLADGSLTGSKVGSGVPAANIASGSLGSQVIASSIAVSGFYSDANVRSNLGLAIGTNVQAYDADLDDLADGSLTGSKVGSGVPAANIASGSLGSAVITSSIAVGAVGAVQMATADHGDVSWSGGVATVDNVAAANITGVIAASKLPGTVAYTTDFTTNSFTVTIASGTGWNGLSIPLSILHFSSVTTITNVIAETMPATSTVTFSLEERAYQSLNASGSQIFSVQYSTANNSGTTITAFADSSIAAKSRLQLLTAATAASAGNPTWLTFTVFYKEPRN